MRLAKITANRTEENRLVAEAIDAAANTNKASKSPKTLFLSAQDDLTDRLIEATISALNHSRLYQVIRKQVTRTLKRSALTPRMLVTCMGGPATFRNGIA